MKCLVQQVAIDLGTANTLVHVPGRGIVVNEPSYVARQLAATKGATTNIIAVGKEAQALVGRSPASVRIIRPFHDGGIADLSATKALVSKLLHRVLSRYGGVVRPRVGLCLPSGISEVEQQALCDLLETAGAGTIYLFSEPLAAAVGAGLPINEPYASTIVDIGGGTTDVAVISASGVVLSQSSRFAGDAMDEAIIEHIREHHEMIIGNHTAEKLKYFLGEQSYNRQSKKTSFRGQGSFDGRPKTLELSEEEIAEVLTKPLMEIVQVIKRILKLTPPELSGDIAERGVTLTGGGSLIPNIDLLISRQLNLPVQLVEDPLTTCVIGCSIMLSDPERYALRAIDLNS